MHPLLEELAGGVHAGLLSPIQFEIIVNRSSDSFTWTWERIATHYQLSGPSVLVHAFLRTACGRFWVPGQSGGRDGYLSDLDIIKFRQEAVARAHDLRCITVHDAITIAASLNRERLHRAAAILKMCNLCLHPHLITEAQPTRSTIAEIVKICDLRIVNSQQLESARRWSCSFNAIADFFTRFSLLFQRDPHLIFNADETMLSGLKRFRVLAEKQRLPLVTAETKLPHLTAMCTISATGTTFKPFVILPHLKGLKKLSEFLPDVHFATTQSGWMNRNIFTAWAICFCSELSFYRMTLPDALRNESVLLVLDGHPSRLNLEALVILDAFDVDVLCLPSHCTHVVQAFDVAVASPLKGSFKEELGKRLREVMATDPARRERTDHLRFRMVEAFLEAYRKASTRANCAAGFRASGMVPFDPNVPLSSQYIMDSNGDEANPPPQGPINSRLLTGEDGLDQIGIQQFGHPVDRGQIRIEDVCARLLNATVAEGRQISPFPSMFHQIGPGIWEERRV
jgi:hypothetical protein